MKSRLNTFKLLTISLILLFCHKSFGQPANNNCGGAFVAAVSPSTTCVSTTTATSVGATQSQVGCAGTADDDVWFIFTAGATTQTITVTPGTMTDVVLQVFSGTCAGLTNVVCRDATSGTATEVAQLTGLTVSTVYYFRVHSWGSGVGAGTFSICITSPPPPPSNDDPSGAISITPAASCSYTTFTNANATSSTCGTIPAPGCANYLGGDVWFSVTVPASGTISFDSQTGVMTDAGMAVYAGTSCGVLTLVGCDDDSSPNGSMSALTVTGQTPGNTLYIRMWEYGNDNNGTFGLCATAIIPPANDNCTGAIGLTVNSGSTCVSTTTATSTNASQSLVGCTGTADDDVWFSFTATAVTHSISATPGTINNAVIEVFTGPCAGLITYSCINNTTGATAESSVLTGLTIGTTYFVRVYSNGAAANAGTFTMCVTTPPIPANDDCSGAIGLTVNSGTTCTSTTAGTSLYASQSLAGCTGTADDDVWFSFVAGATTQSVSVTPGTMSDAVVQVFSGSCGALTTFSCVNNTTGATVEGGTIYGLTSGATYFVRVHSSANGSGSGTFTICVTTPPPPPANDNCASSFSLTVNSGSTCATTTTATSAFATQSLAGCSGTADDDVWFSFVAGSTSQIVSVTPGTMTDVVFQVFSGTCAGLTTYSCINSTSGASAETSTITGLTVSSTYFVRVHSSANVTGTGTFTVCVATPPLPPANDNCTGAFTVAVNSSTNCAVTSTATSVNATQSQVACTGSGADDDVWFSFTAGATTQTITITPGTMSDVVLQTFSGTCAGLTNIACTDATSGSSSEIATLTGLTVNNVYFFRVHSYANGSNAGTFTICITSPPPPPANDNCSGATAFPTVPTDGTCSSLSNQSTYGATASGVTPSGACTSNQGTPDDDVWFSFVASATSINLTATYVSGSSDVYWQVFSGACASSMTSLLCTDTDAGGSLTGLTIGQTYYIKLYTYGSAVSTVQNICLSTPYNPCSTFTNIAACGTTVTATIASGTGAYASSSCGWTTPGKELIFTFTPATTGIYNIQQFSSFAYIDYQYKAVSAGCGSTGWTCFDDLSGAATSASPATLTGGVQYYILLDPESSAGGNASFIIICPPTPPANDNCAGAFSVTPNSGSICTSLTNGTVYGATATSFTNGCSGGADDDVWYSFVASSSTHSINITNVSGSTTDMYHSVYSGSCGSLGSPIVCSDPNTSSISGLILGNTYYVRVYTWTSTSGQTSTFSVCITTPPPTGPCGNPANNDYCSNPATLTQGAGTFSSTTSSTFSADLPGNLSSIFCGSIENNSWYYFIATSATASFPFTSVTGCTWGDGVQAQVYSVSQNSIGCCTSFTSSSNCYNPGVASAGTVSATGLVVGQTYILMVDGYAGDVCNFTVSGWTATGILPLDLINFTGTSEGYKNKIEWLTSSDINTSYFTVERSNNGAEFEKLTDVTASANIKNYQAFDTNPFDEITYYRLKQYNFNGSYDYSKIISIDTKSSTDEITNVHPNPTNDNIEFELIGKAKNTAMIELIDNTGKVVISEQHVMRSGHDSVKLNLEKLDVGIYLLKSTFESSGKVLIKKIIKR